MSARILIITALPEERDAVLEQLSGMEKVPLDRDDSRVYFRGSISCEGQKPYDIIVVCLSQMGRVAASSATFDAINKWSPAVVFLVGIAGGISINNVEIGDVLVAHQIVDYEQQKVGVQGRRIRYQTYRVDAKLYEICNNIREAEWAEFVPAETPGSIPKVHCGPIASGDKVVADGAFLDDVLESIPKLIGIEMEAGGVAHAVSHSQLSPRFMMIRGVSDLADGNKDAEETIKWRRFACTIAVSFLMVILKQNIWVLLDRNSSLGEDLRHRNEDRALWLGEIERLSEVLCRERVSGLNTSDTQRQLLAARRELRAGPQLAIGDFLSDGRYELIEPVGQGGFATVWRAIDRKAQDIVAIKVLHSQWSSDTERVERFQRGAKNMRRLGHQHVVQVIDDGCFEDGFHYYVMELAGPNNLRKHVLEKGGSNLSNLDVQLRPVFQIGEALRFAHERGIIHRDVKPQNIMIDENGYAKLTDFDLVWVADTTGGTRTGALGTFVYAAPECLENATRATVASDVFSLAMVTLFILNGADLSFDVFRDPAAFIAGLTSVPTGIRETLSRATEWDTGRRTRTIQTFLEQLRISLQRSTLSAEVDGVEWIDHGGFAKSCVDKIRGDYVEARASKNWNMVVMAASEFALILFERCRTCFESGAKCWDVGISKSINTFNLYDLESLSHCSLTAGEERVLRWMAARRLVLLILGVYRIQINADRRRLETLIVAMFDFIGPEERDAAGVRGRVSSALFTLRPLFTQWGFAPGGLVGGVKNIATLGALESSWFDETIGTLEDLEVHVPAWWDDLYRESES